MKLGEFQTKQGNKITNNKHLPHCVPYLPATCYLLPAAFYLLPLTSYPTYLNYGCQLEEVALALVNLRYLPCLPESRGSGVIPRFVRHRPS